MGKPVAGLAAKINMPNRYFALLVCVILGIAGCASVEYIPKVNVLQNDSGITIADSHEHGQESLPGGINVPSGTTVALKRLEPLHNQEPRYFIPASGSLQIVCIRDPQKYKLTQNIEQWRRILDGKLSDAEIHNLLEKQLGEIPWMNAARCFHAKLQRHDFPWGKAVLFITTYVQGKTGGPVNNDMLALVVQGVTTDKKYAVNGHFEIRHPDLPINLWDKNTGGKAVFDIDEETTQAEKWLNSQPDDSFQPPIQKYIDFLDALTIKAK